MTMLSGHTALAHLSTQVQYHGTVERHRENKGLANNPYSHIAIVNAFGSGAI
jgi:hypothetical protein